jgi:hypothetical protein
MGVFGLAQLSFNLFLFLADSCGVLAAFRYFMIDMMGS